MAKINPVDQEEEEVNSKKSLSHASSSSLRLSKEDEDETGEGHNGRRKGWTFEELATKVIREIRKAKEEGTTRSGEPLQPLVGANNEDTQEDSIREILNLIGTDDEVDAEEDDWKRMMEETVNTLVAENAKQRVSNGAVAGDANDAKVRRCQCETASVPRTPERKYEPSTLFD